MPDIIEINGEMLIKLDNELQIKTNDKIDFTCLQESKLKHFERVLIELKSLIKKNKIKKGDS